MPKLQDITAEQSAALVTAAKTHEGTKYFTGGGAKSSPTAGFDCSGLVWYTIKGAGYAYTYSSTSDIPHNQNLRRLKIPPDQLRTGDLMLFNGHVGFFDADAAKGKTLYSATSHGVRNEDPKYWGGPTGYYRLQVVAP